MEKFEHRNLESLGKGLAKYTNTNRFTVMRLHYSADPNKNEEWVAMAKASYPYDELWEQEMELSFIASAGKRVYPEFTIAENITELKYDPYRPIWRGWDFGYHHPVCIWAQVQASGALHVFGELLGEDIIIEDFARKVKEISKKVFPGAKFMDAGDPAVRQVTDKSERTTADILRAAGIRIQSRKTPIHDGIHLIRAMCQPRPDGFVRLKVDKSCDRLIEAFLGGYIRDDKNKPVKDQFYDHVCDALRYMVVIAYDIRTGNPFRRKRSWSKKRKTASDVTGY